MPDAAVVVPCRDGASDLRRLLPALLAQRLPPSWRLRVMVVDDGSTDDPASVAAQFNQEVVSIVRNALPEGRSRACNRGAELASASLIVFVDADCVPVGENWLASHISAFEAGAELSVGPIQFAGAGFWDKYLENVAVRRDAAGRKGEFVSLTSANLGSARSAWHILHGFDERYTRYGFEDRDLLIRAIEAGLRIAYTPAATVLTSSPASVTELAQKSETAGRWSAPLFRQRHAKRYRRMPFWWFDSKVGPHPIRVLSRPLAAIARPGVALAEWLVGLEWLPFRFRLGFVRVALGLSYLRGTMQSAS